MLEGKLAEVDGGELASSFLCHTFEWEYTVFCAFKPHYHIVVGT